MKAKSNKSAARKSTKLTPAKKQAITKTLAQHWEPYEKAMGEHDPAPGHPFVAVCRSCPGQLLYRVRTPDDVNAIRVAQHHGPTELWRIVARLDANSKADTDLMSGTALPVPYVAVCRDGNRNRQIHLLTENDDKALYVCRVAFPEGAWEITNRLPDTELAVVDATCIDEDTLREAKQKVLPAPPAPPAPKPELTQADAKFLKDHIVVVAVNEQTARPAAKVRPAKVQPIPLKEFGFKDKFPQPKGKQPKGEAFWPEYPGEKVIWQMLATGRYTREQIVETAVAYDKEYDHAGAAKAIPEILGWMRAFGVRGSTAAPVKDSIRKGGAK